MRAFITNSWKQFSFKAQTFVVRHDAAGSINFTSFSMHDSNESRFD